MPAARRPKARRTAPRFQVERLEARDLPAGGLPQPTLLSDGVQLSLNGQTVELTGNSALDINRVKSFFSAADGQAGTTAVAGTLSFAGRAVTGSFGLSEFAGGTSGVAVSAANAAVSFGGAVGIELADADGAFALLSGGVAGKITAEDATDGVGPSVAGLAGLRLDSAGGLSFEVNTTGGAVNKTVPTPLGNVALSYGKGVDRLAGPAEFRVQKANGDSVVRVAGGFTVTDGADGLDIAGEHVGLELYAAGKRVILLGSAAAAFTLSDDGFALVDDSFTVGGFALSPLGGPFQPGSEEFPEDKLVKASTALGPLALTDTGFVVSALTVTDDAVEVMAGLGSESATLSFQKGSANGAEPGDPITMEAEGLAGTFALSGAITGGAVSGFTASGKFAITAQTFTLAVPNLLDATAAGLTIAYDPGAEGEQELVTADQVTVNVPPLGLTGAFDPSDTTKALVVRTDGFAFGRGTLTYNGSKTVGPLTVTNPYVALSDFSFTKAGGVSLGGFEVGAEELSATVGKLAATGTGVAAAVEFDDAGQVEAVSFTVETLTVDLADGLVTLEAEDVGLFPLAKGDETIFEASGATGTLSVAGVTVTGTAGAFSATAAGAFVGPESLGFEVDFTGKSEAEGEETAKAFKWPSFLPVKLRTVAVDFPEFAEDPEKVRVTLSAAVDGTYGPITLQGSVDALVLDPVKLGRGENPFVGIDGFSVGASGKLFGAEVSGTLVGGVIKLDAFGNVTDEDEFAESVVYAGLEGSLSFATVGGLGVRIGFSERGLLQAYFNADVPVLLDPTTGLSLRDFRGGVTFNATPLPEIDDPVELLDPIFTPTNSLTSEQWQEQLKQAVINQASGGSRIFLLEDAADDAADALGNGTVSAGLAAAFDEAGYPIEDATVTALVPGSVWLIEVGGAKYIAESKGGGAKLDVGTALLVLDGIPTPAAGPVSAELVAAFAENDIVLATSATVAVVEAGAWKLTDDAREYFLTTRGGKLAVTGGAGTKDDLDQVIRIEAGATLFSQNLGGPAAAEKVFRADVDIILTTDGRFLINSVATLADKVSFDLKLYADLNPLVDPTNTAPLSLVTLATFPSQQSQAETGAPQLAQLRGKMTFEFLQGDTPVNPTAGDPFDTFRFKILGYAEAGTDEAPKLVIQGNPDGATFEERAALLGLTVKTGPTTKVDLDLSGKLTVAGGALGSKVFSESALGVDVAGRLTFNKPANKALEVFGALKLTFAAGLSGGPKFLKDAGLSASGSFLLGLNATPDAQDVELTLPGAEPVTITLDPKSLMLEVDGTLTLGASGPGPLSSLGAAVTFDGVAAFKLFVGQNGGVNVDVFVAGQLAVTATAAGKNLTLFSMQGLGLFALRDLGKETLANPIPKLAARVDLKASAGLPGVYEYAGSAQLLLNTTGQVFEYQIPDRLQERLAEIKAKAGMGPLALPAVEDADGNPKLVVQVPAAPPKVVASSPDPTAGPYFYVAFGDLDSERSGANTDPDDDGVVDVSLTVLSAFRLEGDMGLSVSAQGFQLAASARASLASDLVGNLFDARMSGLLTIDGTGLIGALAVTAGAQAPSLGVPGTSAAGSLTFYMGINTTQNNGTISVGSWTRPILKQSAEVYVAGSLALGGFEVDGSFRLFAGATAAGLEVDGKLSLFDLDIFTVRGDAAIYFPGAPGGAGLVINASVIVGNGGKIGVKDLFEIGGSLTLQLDTRAGGYAKVAANNLTITLLDAIEFRGSASITVVAGGDDPYTKLEGSFSADLFGAFSVRASGYFDSRGYFGLDLRGDLKLGSDDFGIQAGFTLFVDHPSDFDLDFGGSGYGRVRAFGITLAGASVGVDYASQADGGDGEIIAEASVTVIGITKSVNITLGYLILPQPIEPNLAYQDPATGALTLNVGDRGILRGVKPSSDSAEAYQIDALGPGIIPGTENVKVRAFGYSKVYYNVPSVGGNFGSRNDQLRVRPRKDGTPFLYALDVSGGGGDDLLINESDNPVTLRGGAGNDVLLGGGGADALFGDDDNDTLAGGAGVDALDGGAGNDELVWEAGRGVDQIAGGTGTDTLAVTGSDAAETFALGASGASVQVAATGGPANQTITAAGVEKVRVDGRAGADTVTVPAGVLAGIGVTAVDVDLSRVPTTPTATDKTSYAVNFQDDGSADTVEVTGTAAADTFTIDAVADAQAGDRVRLVGAGLTVGVVAPGATNDVLRVKGGAGNDTFTLAGPNDGPGFAGRRVKVQLQGEGDNDTAKMPVGGADFDGGTGQNTATFTVVTGDNTALTLNGTQVSAGNGQASAYAGLAEVGVEATVPVTLAVQATHANTTRLALAGGAVSVAGTSGALAITSAGNTAVTLAATGAGKATTFGRAGGSNGGDTLTVGVGLLSAVAGPVTATAIDTINYDDSQDGPNRTLTLTDAGLTGGGVGGALAHSGAKNLELRLGKGNDTANVAASTARVVVTDAGGSDAAVVTVSGNPANLGVRFDAAGTETLVTTSNTVEAVTFLNTGNTARTAWLLDQGRLAGGGRKLLDASATGVLALTLGDGGTKADPNTVTVLRTGQPTTLTARGSTAVTVGGESGNVTATLDEVDHPLGLFTSGSGTNTLILDDTRSAKQAGVDRLRTFARGSVTGPTNKQAATLTYDPAGYAAVTVNLGPADDAVTFTDPAGYATVSGGDGADRFTVSGAAGTTLAIAGGDGNDLLTLLPGANGTASGTVGFAGGAGTDSAVLDATALPTGRSGSFSGTVVAAAGVPSLNLTAPAEVEQVTVKLGGGNDTFDIATAAYAGTFALQGGGGDDAVTVKQLPANGAGQYQLDGQAGQDTVTLVVDGAPTAKQFFAVAPTAEELVVDNRTYSGKGTAPAVNWAVTGTAVTGNGVGVVSTLGADRLFVRGGKNAADAVTVQGTGAGPLEAEVDGDRVAAFEGLNVLTPSGGPVNTLTAPVAVDGLGGARSVATTSDGQWVYAAGVNEAAGVAVLRRTGSGGTTQLAYVGTVALPGGLAPSAVAVGTRSGQQYLYVTDVTGTAARFHTYRINTATGGLTLTDTRTVPGQPDALVRLVPVAPNGGDTVNVLAVEADGSGRELLNFAIDTGGNPTADPQRVTAGVPTSGGDPAVSPDGTRVYLPDAGGGRVAIYARADNGFLTYSNPPNTLTVDGGEQAQVAGNLLLVYSPAGQTITYYELSGAGAGSRPTRVAGTITGVTGGFVPAGAAAAGLRYRAFDYDPADGVLAVLTKSGVQTQVKTYKRSGTTFNPVSTANTPGTSFTEIAHRFGKVVVVAAYQPGEYASSGTVSVYPVSPAGTLGTRADDNFNFQSADNENGPVAVPTISVTTAAYDGGLTNNGGARTVFVVAVGTVADGGSNNSGEVTYRLYDPAAAGAPAAIPVPRPGGGFPLAAAGHPTGQTVWSIERVAGSSTARRLAATSLRPYYESGGHTSTKYPQQTLALTGALAAADRLAVSPDGRYLYLIDTATAAGNRGVFRALLQDAYDAGIDGSTDGNGYGLPGPDNLTWLDGGFTEVADTAVGLNAADLAFGNGKVYAVGTADKAVSVLTPNTVFNNAPIFTAALVVNNGDVWDTGRVTIPGQDPVAVAVSPDGTRLYVGTNGGAVATVLPGADGMTVEGTAASDPAGVNALLRSGNTLFAATAAGTLRRFTVGTNSALTAVASDILTDDADLRLSDPKGLALGGDATSGFVFVAAENAASAVPLTGGALGTKPSVRAVVDGATYDKPVTTLTAGTASSDGRWLYGVSAADNAFVTADTQTGQHKGFTDGSGGATGLGGVAFVARAAVGGQDYVFTLSPAEGVLTTFLRDFDGSVTIARTDPLAGSAGATGMAYYPGQGKLYVLVAGKLRTYSLYPSFAPTYQTETDAAGAAGVFAAQDRVFVTFPAAGEVRQYPFYPSGSPHFTLTGLTGVSAATATADRLFVASADGKLRVYGRNGDAAPTLLQTFTNGIGGVGGLLGASAIEATTDGRYVFVAGKAEGAVAVFALVNGQYRFAQVVRDGRGGVNGIAAPVGLAVRGTTLAVTSATGAGAAAGGFARLTFPAAGATAPPIRLDTRFEAAEAFTLRTYTPLNGNDTANQADLVRVLRAPTAGVRTVTVETGGNDDTVSVADLGPRASGTVLAAERFTLNLGAGKDTATIAQTVTQTAGRDLTVTAGAGDDEVSVVALPAGMAAAVNVNAGGADIDIVRVKGTGVPSNSALGVNGDLATGTVQAGTFAGDALFYDPDGRSAVAPSSGTAGDITLSGTPARGTVSYAGLNRAGGNQQVFVQTPPRPAVPAVTTINEGQGVTLSASDPSGLATAWAWDLNGDGAFNDAYTPSVTLLWPQLQALGIDDNGTYPVAVRATNAASPQAFGGRSYALSADAAGTLKVDNVGPTVTAPNANAKLQDPFRVLLRASADPGDDRITKWAVRWGLTGAKQSFGADATEAFYSFPAPGTYRVTVWAFDEDRPDAGNDADGYSASTDVVVTADGKAVSPGGPYTVAEGDGAAFTAAAAGSPTGYEWAVSKKVLAGFTAATAAPTWADLKAAGVTNDGRYDLTVTAWYGPNKTNPVVSDAVRLTVTNTLPTGTLALSGGSTAEGGATGAVTVRVAGAADPSDLDLAGLSVRYDWDNNGTYDTPASKNLTAPVGVPDTVLATSGLKTIRAGLFDDRGARDLFVTLNVTDVAPTIASLAPTAATLAEGGTVALDLKASDPGDAITRVVIDWGDGSPAEELTTSGKSLDLRTPAHRYADGGPGAGTPYTVTVTVVTAEASATATTAVRVTDVAPAAVLTDAVLGGADRPPPTEGAAPGYVVTVALADPAGALDPVSAYTVDWGDGTADTVTGDVTKLAHTYAQAGLFSVRVTSLTNDDGTFTGVSNTLTVRVKNAPPAVDDRAGRLGIPAAGEEVAPVLLSATAASVATGSEPLTFTWSVAGPNGFTDGLAVVGAAALADPGDPTGYAFVARAGFEFTPPDGGDYLVTLTVTDDDGGSATVTRTVTVANRAPTITAFDAPATGAEAQPLTFRAAAADPAGAADPLTYTWTFAGPGGTTALTGPEVIFTPAGGEYVVTLTVDDGDGGTDTRTAALSVVNLAPELSAVEVPATATEGNTVTVRATASDPGGSALTYTWRVDRPGRPLLTLTGAEVSFLVPDNGTVTISLEVADAAGLTATATRTILVGNAAPAIADVTVPTTGTEGVPLALAATATDPAGAADVLSYRWVVRDAAGAEVVTLGGPSPLFTPPNQGTYTVTLTVTDDDGGTAPTSPVRTIAVANADPVLVGTPKAPAGVIEGDTVALSLAPATKNGPVVSDVAADLPNVRYTWVVTGPGGFRYESAPAASPAASFVAPDNGAYTATVTATDGDGGSASKSVDLTVANADPVVATYSVPTTGYVGHAVVLTATATDRALPGYDPLTFTWAVTDPDGVPVPAPQGSPSGFTPGRAGTYAVVLTVTDGDGGSASRTFTVAVAATPIRVVTFDAPATGTEGSAVRLRATATDDRGAQGGTPVLTWTITPPDAVGAPFTLTGTDVSFTPPENGTYQVLLTAAVGNDVATRAVGVVVANAAPTLTAVAIPESGSAGVAVPLAAAAADPAGAFDPLTTTWTIVKPNGEEYTLGGGDASFTPDAVGLYGVRVDVADGDGGHATASGVVAVLTGVAAAPAVAGVTSPSPNGTYGAGAVIPVAVTFTQPVTVTGMPKLALNSGGTAVYASGSGTDTLTFSYTVGAGDAAADLDAASATALTLNGGSITGPGAAADLTLPAPGAAGSLAANKNLVIEASALAVVEFRVVYGTGRTFNVLGSTRDRLPWAVTGIQVVFNKAVAAGTAKSLTGRDAGTPSGLGTNTLTWTFAKPADLGQLPLGLQGAGADGLADALGNRLGHGTAYDRKVRVLTADYNDDGVVNATDVAAINAARTAAYDRLADANGDGVVDAADVTLARGRIGTKLS